MKDKKQVLIIGTYGIDVFHRITDELEVNESTVLMASTKLDAFNFINNWRFDFIIINLEPDGKGHIADVDILSFLEESSLQQDAICLGVSLNYPHALPQSIANKHLHVLAGWLTIPIDVKNLSRFLHKMTTSTHKLTIRNVIQKQEPALLTH